LRCTEVGHKKGALFVTERKFNGQLRAISRRRLRQLVKEAMERVGIVGDYTKTVYSLRHTEDAAERFISYESEK